MFGQNPFAERARKTFNDQFERDGVGYLYRQSLKGAPIRVSASERDEFIAAYNRSYPWLVGSSVIIAMAIIVVLVFSASAKGVEPSPFTAVIAATPSLLIIVFGTRWAWNAPARKLRGRIPVGQPLPKAEVTRLMFARMSYGQLGFAALIFVACYFKFTGGQDLFSGWNRLWLALLVLGLGFAGFQAFRKWRFERGA